MLDIKSDLLPLSAITQLIDFKKALVPLIYKNEHLFQIEEVDKPDRLLTLSTKEGFSFLLFQPAKQANSNEYTVRLQVCPHVDHVISTHSAHLKPLQIIVEFNKWISYLKRYNEATEKLKNPFDEELNKEINELFNFLPEEGDETETYSVHSIVMLEELLSATTERITKECNTEDPKIKEILNLIEEIKIEAPSTPRAVIKKKLSKAFGGIKKHAWPTFKWLLQETAKEIIKEGLKGNLNHFIQLGL